MPPLKKISNDPKSSKKIGRYKDKEGYSLHGVFQRDYQKTQDILYINNGYLMAKYKYPKIDSTFESPMLNLSNLHLCGGWRWPNVNGNEEIINRVIQGLKPMGDIVDKSHNIEKFKQIADKEGLTYLVYPHSWEEHKGIMFCRDGKFNKIFDIGALFSDYCKYHSIIFKRTEGEYLNFRTRISNSKLSDYLGFDVGWPNSNSDFMIIGLILGYPVWSTVAVMWMK